eukprot:jgi/Mesvir1/301/Mv13625-RA.2
MASTTMNNCIHPSRLSPALAKDGWARRCASAGISTSGPVLKNDQASATHTRSSWRGFTIRGFLLPRGPSAHRCRWTLVNARAEGPTRNIEPGARFLQDIGLEDSNDDVKLLQTVLANEGHLGVEPTGYFGRVTLDAVKSWQEANGLPPSGFVGPQSRLKLNAALKRGEDARRAAAAAEARNLSSERSGSDAPETRAQELHSGRATQLAHAMASAGDDSATTAAASKALSSAARSASPTTAGKSTPGASRPAVVVPAGAKQVGAAVGGSASVAGPPWLPQKILPVHAVAGIVLTLIGVYLSHRANLMSRKRQLRSQRSPKSPPSPRLSRLQEPENPAPFGGFFNNAFKRPIVNSKAEGKQSAGGTGRSKGQWQTLEPAGVTPPMIPSQRDRMLSRQGRAAAARSTPAPPVASPTSSSGQQPSPQGQEEGATSFTLGNSGSLGAGRQEVTAGRRGRDSESSPGGSAGGGNGNKWQTVGTPVVPGMSSLLASAAAREGEGAMLRRAGPTGSFVGFSFGEGAGRGGKGQLRGEAAASSAAQGSYADSARGDELEDGDGEFERSVPPSDKRDRGSSRPTRPSIAPSLSGADKAGWTRREPRGLEHRRQREPFCPELIPEAQRCPGAERPFLV